MDIKIRKVPYHIVARLDSFAKNKGISREQYLRNELEVLALSAEIKASEDRYINVINKLLEIVARNNEIIEKNNFLLEEFMEGIDTYENSETL